MVLCNYTASFSPVSIFLTSQAFPLVLTYSFFMDGIPTPRLAQEACCENAAQRCCLSQSKRQKQHWGPIREAEVRCQQEVTDASRNGLDSWWRFVRIGVVAYSAHNVQARQRHLEDLPLKRFSIEPSNLCQLLKIKCHNCFSKRKSWGF
jgi:hypothetical protein